MPNKMERFTQQARRVLMLAQEAADQMHHSTISTEHLLLGLMRDESGVAGHVLRNLGVKKDRVEELVQKLSRAETRTSNTTLDLSSSMKRVLELSVDEARSLGHHYVGTEHLLLGLVKQWNNVAINVLTECGINPDEVRRQTRRVLQESPLQSRRPQPPEAEGNIGRTVYDYFERLTPQGQRVFALAREVAAQMNRSSIGAEHLLLALMRAEGGIAAQTLRDLGIEQSRLEEFVKEIADPEATVPGAPLELSPNLKRVLEMAVREAQSLDHPFIGTEHLLLGLILVYGWDSTIIELLNKFGVQSETVYRQTRLKLQEFPVQSSQSQPSDSPSSEPSAASVSSDPPPVIQESSTKARDPFERFTHRARQVMSLAQEEAERLSHSTIGTEHLLLGMMREDGGVAGRVLRDLGIEPHRLTQTIGELSTATTNPSETPLELSADTKQLLKLAVDEARRMGHHYIGTEHLLLGLVRQSDNVAVHILKRLGISPEEVRRQTRRVLQANPIHPEARIISDPPPSTKPSPSQSFLNREHVTNTKAFEILRTAITQIFDMVAAEKLTTAQAAELLTALQPYLSPSTGQRALLIAHAINAAGVNLEKRQLRILIRDKKTRDVAFEILVSLPEAMESLETLLEAVLTNYPGWLWAEDVGENNRLEIQIEEDGE